MPSTPPTVWKVEVLRLSVFPEKGTPVAQPDNWWETFTGSVPETSTNKPREGIAQVSGSILEGKAQMSISCAPDRIDWQWFPDQNNFLEFGFPAIDNLDSLLPPFTDMVKSWLDNGCPPIQRLAFGAVVHIQVSDKIAAYSELARLLPYIEIDVEGSSDFQYSINRPRPSTLNVDGLSINRVSKWNAIHLRSLRFLNSPDVQFGSPLLEHEVHSCRLELDINNVSIGLLPYDQLKHIMDELVTLAKEITELGDIK